jgi:hypothetical protein
MIEDFMAAGVAAVDGDEDALPRWDRRHADRLRRGPAAVLRAVDSGRPRAARRESHCSRPGHRRRVASRDGPDDDPGEPEPPIADPWRWADPASWRAHAQGGWSL